MVRVNSFCSTDLHDGEYVPADWKVKWGKGTFPDNKTYFCCDSHIVMAILTARHRNSRQRNYQITPVNIGHRDGWERAM